MRKQSRQGLPKLIAFFNHKGGVGKTTSCYNVGWCLAEKFQKKVLMIDADPQCNLTALFGGFEERGFETQQAHFFEDKENYFLNLDREYGDIYKLVAPLFGLTEHKKRARAKQKEANENLFLLPGNLALATYEKELSLALSTKYGALRKLPSSFYQSFLEFYADYDYLVIDLSPNLGVINQCILMGCTYFILPAFPDYFSLQAVEAVADLLRGWNKDIDAFRENKMQPEAVGLFSSAPPKFVGMISQNFRIRPQEATKGFQKWEDLINQSLKEKLVNVLHPLGMSLNEAQFREKFGTDSNPFLIASISDYNTLKTISQKVGLPVTALTEQHLKAQKQFGDPINTNLKNIERFREGFESVAQGLEHLE